MVPSIRFSGFESGWISQSLKEITKINQGLQIPIAERLIEKVEDSHFYITNEFLNPKSEKRYFIKNPPKSVLCDFDDVLMTRTGNTGMVVTNVNGAFHNNFFKIKYKKEKVQKGFLVEFLKLKKTQNLILRYAGTSTIPDLNHSDFYRLKINLPTLPEQQKIASFLGAVDKRIELLQKKRDFLQAYKKGVMQQLFSQQIRFTQDDGTPFPDWEEKRLGEIAIIYQPKTIGQNDFINKGYKVYGANGIIGYYGDYNHEERQVIVTCRGSTCGTINLSEKYSWITGNAMVLNVDENEEINKVFLFNTLVSDNLNYLITGSGQPQITGDIKKHIVKIPKLKEQQKIANFLSAIDTRIEVLEKQITGTQEFKKGLLQQMFV